MKKEKITDRGICTICPSCNMNSHTHYLQNKLHISFCECSQLGRLYIGFSDNPYWKLYSDMSKDEFLAYAQSVQAYVEIMRELHLYAESA